MEEPRWNEVQPDAAKSIENACQTTLDQLDVPTASQAVEISVLLSSDARLRTLNDAYRAIDKPTNILSFPAHEPGAWRALAGSDQPIMLGDLALALETLERESDAKNIAVCAHLTHLTVHGVLHLLGFDHQDDDSAAEMEQLETDLCLKLGLEDPYGEGS